MEHKDYSQMTLREFSDVLGSREPAPGGGGASALCGCIGAALGNMVAHLTVGHKKYAGVEEEMEDIIRQEEILQNEFLDLIKKDAEMFLPLMQAYSMPRGTQEEKDARSAAIEQGLKDACQVPLEIMRNVCRALDLTLIAARDGSRAAVSDAGDAAVFCRASLQGASLNVLINTKMMKDRRLADEYNAAVADMLHKYIPVADNIYSRVLEQLSDR